MTFTEATQEACCNKAVEIQPVDEALLLACASESIEGAKTYKWDDETCLFS